MQQHGASSVSRIGYVHALKTMLAPATMLRSVLSLKFWHTLLQDVSYEPECQI